jgi:hypothetical protein
MPKKPEKFHPKPFVDYTPGVDELKAMVQDALNRAMAPGAGRASDIPFDPGSISALLPDLPNYRPQHYPAPNECWKSFKELVKIFLPGPNYPTSNDFNSGGPWNPQGATQGEGAPPEPPEPVEPVGPVEAIP